VLILILGTAWACAQQAPKEQWTIGVHDLSLTVPAGWDHLDHGLEHRFHRELSQISLADIGPVTPPAYLRQIEHARELFRNDQALDARAHLDRLNLRSAFTSARRWEEFAESWKVARDGGQKLGTTPFEVENAYAEVLRQVARLATPELDILVHRALPELDHGAQRDVAGQREVEIDGCPGMWVETWDRLSHDHRQSYLFVLNGGNLLVARMELGKYPEMQPAFNALVDSLEIHPREGGDS
jgi:hypothetical protein